MQSSRAREQRGSHAGEQAREGRGPGESRARQQGRDSRKVQTTANKTITELAIKIIMCFQKREVQTTANYVFSEFVH